MSTLLNDIYNGTLNTISITGYNGVKSVVILSSWVLTPVKSLYYMMSLGHTDTSHTTNAHVTNTNVITRYDLIDAAERKERERQERRRRRAKQDPQEGSNLS